MGLLAPVIFRLEGGFAVLVLAVLWVVVFRFEGRLAVVYDGLMVG